jgi:uncharacterized membrane protein YcaP (DUF421 family)
MMELSIVIRSVAVYLFIVFAIRLFGKKELSQLSIVDLVFILLISNSVQNAMVGNDSSLLGGLTAATVLFIVNFALKNIMFKSKKVTQVIEGEPITLIYEGKVIERHLQSAEISREELEAAIREHGVADITHVNLAVLEVDGNISILSNNYKRKTRKRRIHKSLLLGNQ